MHLTAHFSVPPRVTEHGSIFSRDDCFVPPVAKRSWVTLLGGSSVDFVEAYRHLTLGNLFIASVSRCLRGKYHFAVSG